MSSVLLSVFSLRFSAYLRVLCVTAVSTQRSRRYAENRREKTESKTLLIKASARPNLREAVHSSSEVRRFFLEHDGGHFAKVSQRAPACRNRVQEQERDCAGDPERRGQARERTHYYARAAEQKKRHKNAERRTERGRHGHVEVARAHRASAPDPVKE